MTDICTIRLRAALAGLILAAGCSRLFAANASPAAPMEGQLTTTLQQAEREIIASRFGVADRLLIDFAEGHANTPEAVETSYWRAVFKLDPLNLTARPRDAAVLLDDYLNAPVTIAHRGAATTLRRTAIALDRPAMPSQPLSSAAAGATAPAPAAATPADAKARDEEMQRLRDELAKANAELERIKKRLSQPNP